MDEYIERGYLLAEYDRQHQGPPGKARELIANAHAADVAPVKHGRWKLDSDPGEPWRYVCNKCGEKTRDTVMGKPRANYCPNCGARMDGGEGNGKIRPDP